MPNKVNVDKILSQLKIGQKHEKEHTKSDKKALKIASDHVKEIPDYYDRLKKCMGEMKRTDDFQSGDNQFVTDNGQPEPQKRQKCGKKDSAMTNPYDQWSSKYQVEGMDHVIQAREILGHVKNNKASSKDYWDFIKHIRDKYGKDMSVKVHQTARKLATEEVEDLEESKALDMYIKSKGWDPTKIDRSKKQEYAQSDHFRQWASQRKFVEEVEQVDEVSAALVVKRGSKTLAKQKGFINIRDVLRRISAGSVRAETPPKDRKDAPMPHSVFRGSKLAFEETQITEMFDIGDKVVPKIGPHKGEEHEVIHVHDDGRINIRPIGVKNVKYKLGAASAQPHQVDKVNESVDQLDEISSQLAKSYMDKASDKFSKRVDSVSNPKKEKSVRKVKNWGKVVDKNVPGFEGVPLEKPTDHKSDVYRAQSKEIERLGQGLKNAKKRIKEEEELTEAKGSPLDRYLRSMGWNPDTISFERKQHYAQSDAFQHWLQTHYRDVQKEETELEESRGHKIVQKALDKKIPVIDDDMHKKHIEMMKKLKKSYLEKNPNSIYKKTNEDKYQDSMAATQTVGMEVENPENLRKQQISKSARMIKSIYKHHKVNEELYDHEKDDKGEGPDGETPKPKVISGGKTMTGEKRDSIEIDPNLKGRGKGDQNGDNDSENNK